MPEVKNKVESSQQDGGVNSEVEQKAKILIEHIKSWRDTIDVDNKLKDTLEKNSKDVLNVVLNSLNAVDMYDDSKLDAYAKAVTAIEAFINTNSDLKDSLSLVNQMKQVILEKRIDAWLQTIRDIDNLVTIRDRITKIGKENDYNDSEIGKLNNQIKSLKGQNYDSIEDKDKKESAKKSDKGQLEKLEQDRESLLKELEQLNKNLKTFPKNILEEKNITDLRSNSLSTLSGYFSNNQQNFVNKFTSLLQNATPSDAKIYGEILGWTKMERKDNNEELFNDYQDMQVLLNIKNPKEGIDTQPKEVDYSELKLDIVAKLKDIPNNVVFSWMWKILKEVEFQKTIDDVITTITTMSDDPQVIKDFVEKSKSELISEVDGQSRLTPQEKSSIKNEFNKIFSYYETRVGAVKYISYEDYIRQPYSPDLFEDYKNEQAFNQLFKLARGTDEKWNDGDKESQKKLLKLLNQYCGVIEPLEMEDIRLCISGTESNEPESVKFLSNDSLYIQIVNKNKTPSANIRILAFWPDFQTLQFNGYKENIKTDPSNLIKLYDDSKKLSVEFTDFDLKWGPRVFADALKNKPEALWDICRNDEVFSKISSYKPKDDWSLISTEKFKQWFNSAIVDALVKNGADHPDWVQDYVNLLKSPNNAYDLLKPEDLQRLQQFSETNHRNTWTDVQKRVYSQLKIIWLEPKYQPEGKQVNHMDPKNLIEDLGNILSGKFEDIKNPFIKKVFFMVAELFGGKSRLFKKFPGKEKEINDFYAKQFELSAEQEEWISYMKKSYREHASDESPNKEHILSKFILETENNIPEKIKDDAGNMIENPAYKTAQVDKDKSWFKPQSMAETLVENFDYLDAGLVKILSQKYTITLPTWAIVRDGDNVIFKKEMTIDVTTKESIANAMINDSDICENVIKSYKKYMGTVEFSKANTFPDTGKWLASAKTNELPISYSDWVSTAFIAYAVAGSKEQFGNVLLENDVMGIDEVENPDLKFKKNDKTKLSLRQELANITTIDQLKAKIKGINSNKQFADLLDSTDGFDNSISFAIGSDTYKIKKESSDLVLYDKDGNVVNLDN